ncbi:ORC1-type DNA replication protein [Candidatus Methanoperedenaceae archaeon GB50]|nr:ORC1-type DNA replication protein [Candidatus Methanoperedenaceae archaeon GB50]CAD7778232.1 MAG: ORC1-type DNA replication protein [Candidatus Methanoperedenaceae archaeon GB50]
MTKLGAINIFEKYLTDVSIFKDRGVLRHTYTPDYLPHRDKEVNSLASIMVAALRGDAPSNILIYGKTGTGKTAVAKYVGMELERHGEICSIPCYVIYLNCEIVDTQYRLLAHLARHFDKDIPMTGWPTDQVYDEFKKAIDSEQIIVIVMLDEIDKLIRKGDDVLYNLSRINGDLKRSRVSIIGISNDLKFTDFLDPRVKSSLGEEEIIFPPYNAEQIEDILKQRAEMAFEPGVLDETVIPLCAAFAAREHGDARRALDILRISAELAEREKSPVVDERHVRDARYKLEVDRVVEVIRTLPTQSKLVLLSILKMAERGADRFTTGEVYTIYRQMCHEIQMEVLTQRRITDLISELDMLGIVNAMVVSKGRYGRTKEISLSVPHNTTQSVLLEDYRVKPLTNFTAPVATQTKLYI